MYVFPAPNRPVSATTSPALRRDPIIIPNSIVCSVPSVLILTELSVIEKFNLFKMFVPYRLDFL